MIERRTRIASNKSPSASLVSLVTSEQSPTPCDATLSPKLGAHISWQDSRET